MIATLHANQIQLNLVGAVFFSSMFLLFWFLRVLCNRRRRAEKWRERAFWGCGNPPSNPFGVCISVIVGQNRNSFIYRSNSGLELGYPQNRKNILSLLKLIKLRSRTIYRNSWGFCSYLGLW